MWLINQLGFYALGQSTITTPSILCSHLLKEDRILSKAAVFGMLGSSCTGIYFISQYCIVWYNHHLYHGYT